MSVQFTEEEARDTARRAYQKNFRLTSGEIGKAIGRSRQAVDAYISDLRAAIQMDIDLKIFRMHILGVPQERISRILCLPQKTVFNHLAKMPELAKWLNSDLTRGFTVSQVAEKHGWTEPMVWYVALEGKSDLERFKALKWGLRTLYLIQWPAAECWNGRLKVKPNRI